jgi:threonine/homoserine/homoserine lactone efflux protein
VRRWVARNRRPVLSDIHDVPAFLAVSVIVIATPGQDTALVVRNTLYGGRRTGVRTAIGVCAGQATWAVATSLGVGSWLVASRLALVTLRLVGGAYLVFLGARAVLSAVRPDRSTPLLTTNDQARQSQPTSLRQGFISNALNPKMLVFFTSLLPQFAHAVMGLLALGMAFCSLALVWLVAYSFAVAKARVVLHRSRVRRATEAFTGSVLIALGARLATEAR